ncbi:uncharacterized protein ycf36 [Cynara cardunculus var. scolymus]|uniref:Uncharacterized protein family Ycf36 n=1 Tax=Cynara cardunculus var. scolymus TaxID=59895 RepID=A0A103XFV9_CYNCS|nr:uncharacterized protein ycf36 [Cynara cardunculus var. scolymus]KVH89909.1 Uncharacterized protein family Ycf36 [Cynara cardunculus var. scolymus]
MALLLSLKPPSPPPSSPPLLLSPLTSSLFPHTVKPSKSHHHRQTRFSFSYSSRNPPETDCPVPPEQQPINEYQSLSTSSPFSWASGDFVEYCSRLLATGVGFALFVGLPVSWYGSVGVGWEPIQRILGAVCSGIFAVTLAVVRMYLGWAYVGNRLLSATVEYEETGWYDGQIWVKTAEVLARDRLLGSFTVKPVLNRLKNTLVTLALSLFMFIVLLINTEGSQKEANIITSGAETGGRAVAGVYNDESARSFEPEAFCGPSMAE